MKYPRLLVDSSRLSLFHGVDILENLVGHGGDSSAGRTLRWLGTRSILGSHTFSCNSDDSTRASLSLRQAQF